MNTTGRIQNRIGEQQLLNNLPHLQQPHVPLPGIHKADVDVEKALMALEGELGNMAKELHRRSEAVEQIDLELDILEQAVPRDTAKIKALKEKRQELEILSEDFKLFAQRSMEHYTRGLKGISDVSASWDRTVNMVIGNMKA